MKKYTNICIDEASIIIDKKRKILTNPVFFVSCTFINTTFDEYSEAPNNIEQLLVVCEYNTDILDNFIFFTENFDSIDFDDIDIRVLQVIFTFFTKNKLNISKDLYSKLNKKLRLVKLNNLAK